MKKQLLFLFDLLILLSCVRVYASPTTYTRTTNDLRLPKKVDLKDVNIDEVLRVPSVDSKAKIYDFADLLTDEEETKIFFKLNNYVNNTGLDAIIVTTNDLKEFALRDYTYRFYDYNDFRTSGVAFVIYVGNDKKSIFMGNNGPASSEVFAAYTDDRVTDILTYVYKNHINKDDYIGACESYISLIDGIYVNTFGSYKIGDETDDKFPFLEIIIVSLVLTFIGAVLVYTKFQKPQRRIDQSIKNALNTTTMVVKCEQDELMAEKNSGNS